jgi:hypothetical protein
MNKQLTKRCCFAYRDTSRRQPVGDHENVCMHDLMMHLRDELRARHSVVHGVLDV